MYELINKSDFTPNESYKNACNDHNTNQFSRLSYVHNPGKEPLKYLTVGNVIEEAAKTYNNIPAILSMYDDKKITYQEILEQSDKLAAGLQSLNLRKGDRIGLWGLNTIEWVIAFCAAARAGFITVAINPNYLSNELKYCLNKCSVKAIICPDEYKALKFYDILRNVLPEIDSCKQNEINSQTIPSLKVIVTICKTIRRGTYNYYELLNVANNNDIKKIQENQLEITPDDICNIQFSSGTTGQPKAACLNHFQIVNNSYLIGKRFDLDKHHQIYCIQVPLFHVFGIVASVMAAVHFGTTLVFPSPTYNSSANLRALQKERCTRICGTPTMFIDLISIQNKENRNICVSQALIGGAPCSPVLVENLESILKINDVKAVYGATEMTAIAFHSLQNENDFLRTKTVGYIGDHVEAKVVDTNQDIVPFGTPGELCIRGYLTMPGYWNDPEKTKEVLDDNRWFRTGDQFVLHENGYGQVVGRLKEMIIRGGENVFPKEIEDLINTHPNVKETYVIGINNERLGEEICACVQLKGNADLNLTALKEFCVGKIASYKIPSQLKIVNNFPKTASGKIQKFLLKQQFSLK